MASSGIRPTSARRAHVARLMKKTGILKMPELGPEDVLTYVIGGLVATSDGHVSKEKLDAGMADEELVAMAHGIITTVRATSGLS